MRLATEIHGTHLTNQKAVQEKKIILLMQVFARPIFWSVFLSKIILEMQITVNYGTVKYI